MLTGMITTDGLLLICRKGAYIQQECPYAASGVECGDWCPQFHEPVEISGSTIQLQLCHHNQLVFARLDDCRTAERFDEEEDLPETRGLTL